MHFKTVSVGMLGVAVVPWAIVAVTACVSSGRFDAELIRAHRRMSEADRQICELERKLFGANADREKLLARVQELRDGCVALERRGADFFSRLAAVPASASVPAVASRYARYDRLVRPVVRLEGDDTIGSGVVISSRASGTCPGTYVMSAYHVARNILTEAGDPKGERGIRITLFLLSGTDSDVADVLCYDEASDLVLLKLRGSRLYPEAKLLPAGRIGDVDVFTPVYAVGCPDGSDLIPTLGEVASVHKIINNRNYWMISAPAYFGNSGGGVYLEESGELIAIFARVYAYGSGRLIPIPHMGYVVPIDAVAQFLEKSGYAFLLAPSGAPASVPAALADR